MSTPPNLTPEPPESSGPLPVSDPFTLPAFLTGPVAPAIPSTKDDRLWALVIHLSGIACSFLLPLVLWLVKKSGSPFIDDQGKEAINFQIAVFIGGIVLSVLAAIIHPIGLLFPLYGLAAVVLSVIAALKANAGIVFRHPFTLRLIK